MPYGYPQANGRERDYGRERRDDYSRADPRYSLLKQSLYFLTFPAVCFVIVSTAIKMILNPRDDYNRRGSGGGPSPR